jgi:hypothetical protein
MKKDIFLATKKNIIAISTIIVFACLIVFAIITHALYSSRVLDNVDHQILDQKNIINAQPLLTQTKLGQIAMAHNGTLVNAGVIALRFRKP